LVCHSQYIVYRTKAAVTAIHMIWFAIHFVLIILVGIPWLTSYAIDLCIIQENK
jgi:hypothetical protein